MEELWESQTIWLKHNPNFADIYYLEPGIIDSG
jgi:hypothetical protein